MMKRLLVVLAMAAMVPMQAQATGVELGYAQWMQSNSGDIAGNPVATSTANSGMIWAELEHPVPVIPNLRYSSSDIAIGDTSNNLNLKFNDLILYYNLWDTLATVDVGFGMRSISGSATVIDNPNSIPGTPIPVMFVNLAGKIPGVGLTVGYRYTGLSSGSKGITSTELYANYAMVAGLEATVGMRDESVNFPVSDGDISAKSSGTFIGIMYKF
ncbi:MAG: hypothetical protein OEX12_04565 [Gammaproteobacteria bacterium]|nr:hypothetical protein [Gammaproteobacteria bacterium]